MYVLYFFNYILYPSQLTRRLEFNYITQKKATDEILVVVMEEACSTPTKWKGPVGLHLGKIMESNAIEENAHDLNYKLNFNANFSCYWD